MASDDQNGSAGSSNCRVGYAAAIHDFEAASPINRRRPQGRLMALTLRPAGLSSGIEQDREDYAVFCGHDFAL
jgi:hypothetical protein